ncbi:unnamed protein product [Pleuronectes platessa]|uniref:Uncharacterized protein n=1 Tax=Pleuronectes platessa TaxID=8262 RepID=A0A9N7UBQ3_PLEPL|nr:unnamed protein product [Pleuronectes platessa]
MRREAQNDELTDEKIAQFESCGTKEAADKRDAVETQWLKTDEDCRPLGASSVLSWTKRLKTLRSSRSSLVLKPRS